MTVQIIPDFYIEVTADAGKELVNNIIDKRISNGETL